MSSDAEFNPQTHCTEFISQIPPDPDHIFARTELETPEAIKYFNYLMTLSDEDSFHIPSAGVKAHRLGLMMISYKRQGRQENVIPLVAHQQQKPSFDGYAQGYAVPVGAPSLQAGPPVKKKHWWSRK